jgi:hypothetical protein
MSSCVNKALRMVAIKKILADIPRIIEKIK